MTQGTSSPSPSSHSRADGAGTEQPAATLTGLQHSQDTRQQPTNLTEYHPKQSAQVVTVPFVTRHGEPYYILANRDRVKYLRLAPDEYRLWTLMDGTRTVEDLIYEYFVAYKTLAFDQVTQFVAQLRRSYMLADPPEEAPGSLQSTGSHPRVRALSRAVWEIIIGQRTLSIHHIDGLIQALHRRVAWIFYTTPLQLLYVILAVGGGALFLRHLISGRYDLFRAGGSYGTGLLLLIGLNFVSLVMHEASHALTAKHYGARVNRGGFLLYFGIPGAFVDTTDVWTKPPAARMATTWAGPYSGGILAGLGAVVVQAMPDSWVAPILHRLSFLWLQNLVFNIIPFLELDGYYLAVDWLEIPLLRERALTFVRRDLWDRLRRRQPLTGQERLLARFGGLSILFSALVLVFAVLAWQYRLKGVATALWAGGVGSKALLVLLLAALGFPLVVQVAGQARATARTALAWARRWRVPHGRALQERETLLRQVHCLSGLSAEEVTQVATRMRHHLFRPGRTVVREGTPPDRFYLIDHGVAEVWVDHGSRPRRRLGRGDYFGETSLRERVPHAGTVRAGSWLSLFAVEPGDFQRWVAPHLCAEIDDRLSLVQALRRFSLFGDLTARELDRLAPRLQRRRFSPGAVVYAEGDPAEALYLVDSGQAEASTGAGQRRILHSGEAFGEAALLRHAPHQETVRAQTALEVLILPRSDIESLQATTRDEVITVERDAHDAGLCHSCGPAAASRLTGG